MTSQSSPLFFTAIRDSLREGITKRTVLRDILAGIVVGIITLPLSLSQAVAMGLPPQYGLYTSIVGGAVAAIFGGCRFQVGGTAAAFVILLAPVVAEFGPSGILVASLGAGVFLILFAFLRFGRFISFIPYPVIAGFTMGLGISIMMHQTANFLGLKLIPQPDYLESFYQCTIKITALQPSDTSVGALTLILLFCIPRIRHWFPKSLVVLPIVTGASILIGHFYSSWQPITIGSHFKSTINGAVVDGLPQDLPQFILPWMSGIGTSQLDWSFSTVHTLIKTSISIALLVAIETLITAVIADRTTQTRHNSNGELLGFGVANLITPFFGGFCTSGAIVRTAPNIRAGGRTPLASLSHCVFLLLVMMTLAPIINFLPMASLAGLLIWVGWNMCDFQASIQFIRGAQRGDRALLILCCALTVAFNMVVAIAAGVLLASVFFMQRMSSVSTVDFVSSDEVDEKNKLPRGIERFCIHGPLFFGSAQRSLEVIQPWKDGLAAVIDLADVPFIDSTGILRLREAVDRLHISDLSVALTAVQPDTKVALDNSRFFELHPFLRIFQTSAEAIDVFKHEKSTHSVGPQA